MDKSFIDIFEDKEFSKLTFKEKRVFIYRLLGISLLFCSFEIFSMYYDGLMLIDLFEMYLVYTFYFYFVPIIFIPFSMIFIYSYMNFYKKIDIFTENPIKIVVLLSYRLSVIVMLVILLVLFSTPAKYLFYDWIDRDRFIISNKSIPKHELYW